jgi:putative endonuclease
MDRTEIGRRGEDAAASYLERIGLTVVERNWRDGRGEIDIVALDGETLVVCEVKTRRGTTCGSPEEAVSATKQRRLTRMARSYIASRAIEPCAVRFDVISIVVLAADRALLRHHRAAFEAV